MSADTERILAEITELLRPLTENLLPGEQITMETRFGTDLGLQSISLANLSGRLQARYGTAANLVPFLAGRAAGPISDIRVGEFVEYIAGVLSGDGIAPAANGNGAGNAAAVLSAEIMRSAVLDDLNDDGGAADAAGAGRFGKQYLPGAPNGLAPALSGHTPRDENVAVLAQLAPGVTKTVLTLPRGDVEVFTAGRGPVLVLMHPINVGAGGFAHQFATLAGRYRVVCIHRPGVGATTWDADLTVGGLARMCRTVLAELGLTPPFHVLGSSFGGLVAQQFALLHSTECASLTLVGCSYGAAGRPGGIRPLPVIVEEELDGIYSGPAVPTVPRAELEQLMLRCESMDPAMGLKYLDALKVRPDLYVQLPGILTPTLILHGDLDSMVPAEDADVLYEAIPDARRAELAGAGHFPCLTHPDQVHELAVPFLAAYTPGTQRVTVSERAAPLAGPPLAAEPGRCIIIGTGRCGSTMLSDLITAEPSTLSVSESLSPIRGRLLIMPLNEFTGTQFWAMMSQPGSKHGHLLSRLGLTGRQYSYPDTGRYAFDTTRVPPILRIPLAKVTDDPDRLFDILAARVPQFPSQTLARHHRMLLDLLANLMGRSRWVERTGASSMVAHPWLAANLDARVVYLTRNSHDTALSMSKHPVFQVAAIRREFHVRYGTDPYVSFLERSLPDNMPEDMQRLLPGNLTLQTLRDRDYDLGFYETMIEQMNGSAEQALADLRPQHLYRVRYEDILSEPVAELTKLGEFIGFTDPAGWAAENAGQIQPPRRPVPSA